MNGWMRLWEFRIAFRLQKSYAEAPDPKQVCAGVFLARGRGRRGSEPVHSLSPLLLSDLRL